MLLAGLLTPRTQRHIGERSGETIRANVSTHGEVDEGSGAGMIALHEGMSPAAIRGALARAPIVRGTSRALTEGVVGSNGPLTVVGLDVGGDLPLLAVRKPLIAQIRQELFAQDTVAILGWDELIAPAAVREDGLYVAMLPGISASQHQVLSPEQLRAAFSRGHGWGASADARGAVDVDRLNALDYGNANADRRAANVMIDVSGAAGIDQGHAAAWLVRTPEGMLAPPLEQGFLGAAHTRKGAGTLADPYLHPISSKEVLADVRGIDEHALRDAHARATRIEVPSSVSHVRTDAFFASTEHADGVIARFRELAEHGQIRSIQRQLALDHPRRTGKALV